jgi:4-amino-4-deoxy-L-arabinose transferase-like glycosyltransferase
MHRPFVYWAVAALLLACAGYLRFHLLRNPEFELGFDEKVYVAYVERLEERGLGAYPSLFHDYVEQVTKGDYVFLPPSRAGYLVPAWAIVKLTHRDTYEVLRMLSAAATWLFMLAGFLFARRWVTPRMSLAVLALLACAPLQIHLAQYAFIDSMAELWALVTVAAAYECLRQPHRAGWAVAAGLGAVALFLTKQELAIFVGVFLVCALLLAKRLGFSGDRRPCAVALLCASLVGVFALILMAGGISELLATFRIYFERMQTHPYAMATGDGPWHRYLLEYLLITPLVFLLALAGIFRGQPSGGTGKYWLLFLVTTYAVMCSLRNGMSLRYTSMWDFPLALFAVAGIASLTTRLRRPTLWAAAVTGFVCFLSLRQYDVIFRELYDTDPRYMLRAVRILK